MQEAPRAGGALGGKADPALNSAAAAGPDAHSANRAAGSRGGRSVQQPWHDGSLEASVETHMGHGATHGSHVNSTVDLSAIEAIEQATEPPAKECARLPSPDLDELAEERPVGSSRNFPVEPTSSGRGRLEAGRTRVTLPDEGVGNPPGRPALRQMILPPTNERLKEKREVDPAALRKFLATAKAGQQSAKRRHDEEENGLAEGQ